MSELEAATTAVARTIDCVDVAEAMVYNEYAQLLENENPETGELFSARRSQRPRLQRARHRHAAGRTLGRASWLADRARQRGHCRPLPPRLVRGMDATAARTLMTASSTRLDQGSPVAGWPPALDDERGQRAGLAVPRRHRRSRPGHSSSKRSTSTAGRDPDRRSRRRMRSARTSWRPPSPASTMTPPARTGRSRSSRSRREANRPTRSPRHAAPLRSVGEGPFADRPV